MVILAGIIIWTIFLSREKKNFSINDHIQINLNFLHLPLGIKCKSDIRKHIMIFEKQNWKHQLCSSKMSKFAKKNNQRTLKYYV